MASTLVVDEDKKKATQDAYGQSYEVEEDESGQSYEVEETKVAPPKVKKKKYIDKKGQITLPADATYPTTKGVDEVLKRKIKVNNKDLQKLYKDKFKGSGIQYKDFAKGVIKEWNAMSNETKLEYGSFKAFVEDMGFAEEESKKRDFKILDTVQ